MPSAAAFGADITLRHVDPFIAVLGGVLSFLSPCVLALVPGYLAYLGGASIRGISRRGLVLNAALFIAGFSVVFVLVFAVFQALVVAVPPAYKNLLTQVGALVVIFLGIQFLGFLRLPFLFRETRLDVAHRLDPGTALSSLVVGMTFALGWTPCIGPILGVIIFRASAQHDLVSGTGLMLLYCAGLAIPFLTAAVLLDRARGAIRALNRRARAVEMASGGLLILFGLLLFTGQFTIINGWLAQFARYMPQG